MILSMSSRFSQRTYLLLPVFLVAGYLLYWPSFSHPWLMDDFPVVVNNPDIRSFANFLEDFYPGRPLRELTYLLDYRLFGLNPKGYHLQQIFWHGLNSFLVFLSVLKFRGPRSVAWVAALFFLMHPLQVEVVANISHRKDSLATAFCLASLIAYLQGRYLFGTRRILWYVAALLLWFVAVQAKETAFFLVFVFVTNELLELCKKRRTPFLLVVGLGVATILGWVFFLLNDQVFLDGIRPALLKLENIYCVTPGKYFLTVLKSWAFMAKNLIWPVALTMEYSFSVPVDWLDPWALWGLILGGALLFLFCWTSTFSRGACLALAWLLAFWLPTSNLLGHGAYFAADRYWYGPLVGVCILVSLFLWWLCRKKLSVFIVIAFMMLMPLAWLTLRQQDVWQNSEHFYAHMMRVNPNALEGLIGSGTSAINRGDYVVAKGYFESALSRSSRDARIPQNLGVIADRQGSYEEALGYFKRALEIDPKLVEAYKNIGTVYDKLGQSALAIEAFQRSLRINPHYESGYLNLGVAYERMGKLDLAEANLRRAILERSDYAMAYYNLGVTLYRLQRKAEARVTFALAAQLAPKDADAWYNYGLLAAETGSSDEAMAALGKLQQLDSELAAQLRQELNDNL